MKKLIKEPVEVNVVHIDEINHYKIYAFADGGDVFKLHEIDNTYAFIDMDTTCCLANGYFKTAREALNDTLKAGYTIYEFEDSEEFFKWALAHLHEEEEE